MANYRKAGTNAFSAALAAAPTANPWVIGGSAVGGAVVGALSPKRTFDENPFRAALRKYKIGVRSGARRSAAEAGSQTGTALAAQGLSASPLGQGIAAGQRRLALQRGEDHINMAEGTLEADIAAAKESIRQANDAEFRSDLTGVATAGLALADNIATENSPLREKAGLPRIESDADKFLKALQDSGAGATTAQATITGPTTTEAPKTSISLSTAPQDLPPLSYSSRPEAVDSKLKMLNIPKGSKLGRAYHSNPYHMQELEDAFGIDMLKDVFNLGV